MRLREVPPPCRTCMEPSSILSQMTPRFSSSRDDVGRVLGEHAHQFRLVLEVAAADGIEVMAGRRIGAATPPPACRPRDIMVLASPMRSLVAIIDLTPFAHRDHRGPAAGAAAADDQQVGFVVGLAQMDVHQLAARPGMGFEHVGHLGGQLLARVGADAHARAWRRR